MGNFQEKISFLQQQITQLQDHNVRAVSSLKGSLPEVFEDLSSSLEELQVAEEELRVQNEELMQSRNTIEAERKRYVDLFDFAPDGYLVTDLQGTIQEANLAAARLLAVSPGYLEKKPLIVFLSPVHRRTFHRRLLTLVDGNEIRDWELRLHPRNGSPVCVSVTVGTVRDPRNNPVGLRWLLRDITERKRAELALKKAHQELEVRTRDLERSNQELQQFAYLASHDLQEPLRMVASYMQLLEMKYAEKLDSEAREFIGYAMEGAQRMKLLIDDLLELSRVGTRGKPFVPVDCEKVLPTALRNLSMVIEDAGAGITHDPLPTVVADEMQLIQVFQNLIGNAVKFRGEAPPLIHISAAATDSEWLFSVRDNGIGIAQEYFDRIFKIFQRLHPRRDYPGTGMGLAIVKRIVERHGGRVCVESNPGVGSIFYFTLPMRGLKP